MNKLNILSWNIRGLGKAKRKRLVRVVMIEHKIDIIALQETKLESIKERTLRNISLIINNWFILHSTGRSGGILVGINEDYYQVVNSWIGKFSVSILIKNKATGYEWLFTSVYGPSSSLSRINF